MVLLVSSLVETANEVGVFVVIFRLLEEVHGVVQTYFPVKSIVNDNLQEAAALKDLFAMMWTKITHF